jgi:hypothetical protein
MKLSKCDYVLVMENYYSRINHKDLLIPHNSPLTIFILPSSTGAAATATAAAEAAKTTSCSRK